MLIVDDEFSIRLICSIKFAASGWQCTEAVDGMDALERVAVERPDVVLLDVMMPRADGWTVPSASPRTRPPATSRSSF